MSALPHDFSSRHALFLAGFAVVAAIACIGIPAWQLLATGPFQWAIEQPFTWQGGLEALVLIGLVGGGCAIGSRAALLCIVALPLTFYLRRHAVDVALLIDLLYVEIVIGLGALVMRGLRARAPADARGYLQAFALGLIVWSIVAWSASALGVGSIKTLRALTALLAIPAACGGHAPLALYLWRRLRMLNAADRFWCGAIAAWVAVLYARTNVVFGYDSLWYGLRPEYVLDPGKSVFQPLGLVSPVHYFPKLYEVFLLPVSVLGDTSVVAGMTLWMLVLVLLACRVIARRIGLPPRVQLPVLALIATLPALANSALEPKPDVIAALFVLLAADAAFSFIRSRAAADVLWLLIFGSLACLAKLTAIPYIGVLLVAALIAAWLARSTIASPAVDVQATRLAFSAAIGTLVVAAFVIARTWSLAGMPTIGPDPLFRLWTAFGLTLTAPVGTLQWTHPQNWAGVPVLLIDWLFRPQRLTHIVISWIGNVWLWCAALALAAWPLRSSTIESSHSRWPLTALITTGAVLAVGFGYQVRGSDGNYFLAALLPAILVSAMAAFTRLATAPRIFAIALACLPCFVLFQAGYAFVSGGWWPGTKTFDLNLARNWHDTRLLRWDRLRHAGLGHIGRYLKELPGDPRAIGYVAEPTAFWLPARWEHLYTIWLSHPEYVNDSQRFTDFMRAQHIDYLILPKASVPKEAVNIPPAVQLAIKELQSDPRVREIDDRDYVMLDLSALHGHAGASVAGAN